MKILVTGGTGLIGKSLVRELKSRNLEVYEPNWRLGEASMEESPKKLFTMREYILDREIDSVVHLASIVGVQHSWQDPVKTLRANCLGTLEMLTLIQETPINNFIFSSSINGYLNSKVNFDPLQDSNYHISPYELSKIWSNILVRDWCQRAGVPWSTLALSNVYGPVEDMSKGVVFDFYRNLSNGTASTIYGVNTHRDFIYVGDVVDAFLQALHKPVNQVVEICSGQLTSLSDLYDLVCSLMGVYISPVIQHERFGQPEVKGSSNKSARELLNWEPKTSLADGLKRALIN